MIENKEIPGDPKAERNARIFIISTSLAIPLAVAVLYFMPKIEANSGALRSFLNGLPMFNAINNGITAVILLFALIAIRKKKIEIHRKLMTSALLFSVLFLLSYVTYHATSESTIYPKDAPYRSLYLLILSTHIMISAIIVPLVLISYTRALAKRFDKHRKIAKITWPLWFYVAITGVLVYIFISPYYQF
jgi:putative membrane protein